MAETKKSNTLKTNEAYITECRQLYGDTYDYTKTQYVGAHKKICVTHKIYGDFFVDATNFLRGHEPKCIGGIKQRESCRKKYNTEWFIGEARKVHGDRYDYSKAVYSNSHTKVCIICPDHGEFWQTPNVHLRGSGCPKCAEEYTSVKNSLDQSSFIRKAKEVHGNRYDYSKADYNGYDGQVCIICPDHGEFWQKAGIHLRGCGCPKCKNAKSGAAQRSDIHTFISRAQDIHRGFYDYSKTEYVNADTKVCIICPEHGEFWQTPTNHLKGQGCPVCAIKKNSGKKTHTLQEFTTKAKAVHGDKYDYSKVEYINAREKVCIVCPEHGEFWQEADSHLRGSGCPSCSNSRSDAEEEIYDFCASIIGKDKVIRRDRERIKPYELDIFIPELNMGIEYHGLLWHCEKYKDDKGYHLKKLNLCREQGIKLVQIFEDEYLNNKDIVLEKLRHLMRQDASKPKIYGRKCCVNEISYHNASAFLDKNHIQNSANGSVYLGAFYDGMMVGVMCFKKKNTTEDIWELVRFASNNDYVCCGVGGKIFQYFVRRYAPNEIVSFADRRWTINEVNNLYIQLGFIFEGYIPPDYKYFKPSGGFQRIHKFNFRKQILHKKYGLPLTMTESEMAQQLGYYKIYDCGLIKYKWIKNDATSTTDN